MALDKFPVPEDKPIGAAMASLDQAAMQVEEAQRAVDVANALRETRDELRALIEILDQFPPTEIKSRDGKVMEALSRQVGEEVVETSGFLNPGFHVEVLPGLTEAGLATARLWGGYVERLQSWPMLTKFGIEPVSDMYYFNYGDSFSSASEMSSQGIVQVSYESTPLSLDEYVDVTFDPAATFFVYVEIAGYSFVSGVNLKTVSGATVPADVILSPFEPGEPKRNVTIAQWEVANQRMKILCRGPIQHSSIQPRVDRFS